MSLDMSGLKSANTRNAYATGAVNFADAFMGSFDKARNKKMEGIRGKMQADIMNAMNAGDFDTAASMLNDTAFLQMSEDDPEWGVEMRKMYKTYEDASKDRKRADDMYDLEKGRVEKNILRTQAEIDRIESNIQTEEQQRQFDELDNRFAAELDRLRVDLQANVNNPEKQKEILEEIYGVYDDHVSAVQNLFGQDKQLGEPPQQRQVRPLKPEPLGTGIGYSVPGQKIAGGYNG